ncbi:hypothetical protein [Micromonospora deserti]|uniref:hypothetical protein n=1 Tax=Micromonospora deserti TaxID=2070366 RepID=UPI003F6A4D0C
MPLRTRLPRAAPLGSDAGNRKRQKTARSTNSAAAAIWCTRPMMTSSAVSVPAGASVAVGNSATATASTPATVLSASSSRR